MKTTTDRPLKVRLHVNKREISKGAAGLPWTIHTSRACTSARSVQIQVPCTTEFRPDLPTNPKVFLVCRARVRDLGGGHFALV